MTRDEIYEHLAQVYLGKKNKNQIHEKQKLNAWLIINIAITLLIFSSAFYGFTAFLTTRSSTFQDKIIYALNKGPIRFDYHVGYPRPSIETFSLTVPQVDAKRYGALQFAARGYNWGYPKMIRVELRNKKNEISSVVIDKIGTDWETFSVDLKRFEPISDWSNIVSVSFIIEAWNIDSPRGGLLIDDVCFSS